MAKNVSNRRERLALELLADLKEVMQEAECIGSDIEISSTEFITSYVSQNKKQVDGELEKYRNNTHEIQKLSTELTEEINSWYTFISDSDKMCQLLYPLKCKSFKKKLDAKVQSIKDMVEKYTIENRFIYESLTEWENRTRQDAVSGLKDNEAYRHFAALNEQKAKLEQELCYILPTIEDVCPISLKADELDSIMKKITG